MFFLKKLFAKKADSKNDETNEGALLPDTDFAEDQNAESDNSEFFENSPSDEIEEVYFYRIFGADSFLRTNQKNYDADEPLILRTDAGTGSKSAYINETYIPVKSSGENFLQLEDGTKLDGYVVEYAQPFSQAIFDTAQNLRERVSGGVEQEEKIQWYKTNQPPAIHALRMTKDAFTEIMTRHSKNKISRLRKAALLDKNGDRKDFFYLHLTLNWTRLSFEIEIKTLARSDWDFMDKHPFITTINERYSFQTGTFHTENNSFSEDDTTAIPKEMFSYIIRELIKMRDKWAGKKLGFTCAAQGIEAFRNITRYPYEPNIAAVISSIKQPGFSVDRKNPTVFNELCTKLNIPNFKALRKIFITEPAAVAKCHVFVKAGFSDVNILARLIQAKELDFVLDNEDDFIEFVNNALNIKSEISITRLLLRKTNYYMQDCIRMISLCRSYTDESMIKRILDDGFTRYNHDVLSKTVRNLEYSDTTLKYSAQEKKYACKIEDYVFHLPKTTGEIRNLGTAFQNCVASYIPQVLSKKTTIVYATKGNEYEMCIEVVKNRINQVKEKYNDDISPEQNRILQKWANMQHLYM